MSVKKIWIDLDDTVLDFKGHYLRTTGHYFDIAEDPLVRWRRLIPHKIGFYKTRPAISGAKEFIEVVQAMAGEVGAKVGFLTAKPSLLEVPLFYSETFDCVATHFPLIPEDHISVSANSKCKQTWAMPGSVLIDNSELNVQQWKDQGGIGILHRDFEQSLEILKNCL